MSAGDFGSDYIVGDKFVNSVGDQFHTVSRKMNSIFNEDAFDIRHGIDFGFKVEKICIIRFCSSLYYPVIIAMEAYGVLPAFGIFFLGRDS